MKMAQTVYLSRTTTHKLQHQLQSKIKNQPTHREEVLFRHLRSLRHHLHHQAAVPPPSLSHQPVVIVIVVVAAVLHHRRLRLLLLRHPHRLPLHPLPPPHQVTVVQHLQQAVVLKIINNQPRHQEVEVKLLRRLGQALHQMKTMN